MCLDGFLKQNALQLTFRLSIRLTDISIIKVAAFHRPLEGYPELPNPLTCPSEAVSERQEAPHTSATILTAAAGHLSSIPLQPPLLKKQQRKQPKRMHLAKTLMVEVQLLFLAIFGF